ncbi:MAG: response regulator [Myxococcota bacterium]
MRALVVDDSRAMRTILSRILRELGFDPIAAVDGVDALEKLGPNPVDLALVDWNMPNMNGLDLVKNLRSNPMHLKTPIVMVTTESDVSRMTTALEAGADEYVLKPFTKEVLEEKLRILQVVHA